MVPPKVEYAEEKNLKKHVQHVLEMTTSQTSPSPEAKNAQVLKIKKIRGATAPVKIFNFYLKVGIRIGH